MADPEREGMHLKGLDLGAFLFPGTFYGFNGLMVQIGTSLFPIHSSFDHFIIYHFLVYTDFRECFRSSGRCKYISRIVKSPLEFQGAFEFRGIFNVPKCTI